MTPVHCGAEAFAYRCLPLNIARRMFPAFPEDWIRGSHVWRARYAQPLVLRGYSKLIPEHRTTLPGAYIASMAQVYPEDRGTNYAIREGRKVAGLVDTWLAQQG